MDLFNPPKFTDTASTAISFSGKIGNDPGLAEFLVRLTVVLREKDLHQATRNVIVQDGENVNVIRPIPLN